MPKAKNHGRLNPKVQKDSEEEDAGTAPRVITSQCTPDSFEDGDLRLYLEKFEVTSKANGWGFALMKARLPVFLKGRAFLHYQQLEVETGWSWDQLKNALVASFHPKEEELSWLRRFHQRILLPNEPLESFSADLKRMLRFGLPSVKLEDVDNLLKLQFLAAIPSTLATKLESFTTTLPFEKLVIQARTIQLEASGRSVPPMQSYPAQALESLPSSTDVEMLKHTIEALQMDVQRLSASGGQLRCYNCGKLGHIARDCRSSKRKSNNVPAGNGRGSWRT